MWYGGVARRKAHPVVPGWSICSMRVPCAGDLRRARGGTGWVGRDRLESFRRASRTRRAVRRSCSSAVGRRGLSVLPVAAAAQRC